MKQYDNFLFAGSVKSLAVFILAIFVFKCNGQTLDTIRWSPCYQLKYEDFQNQPDSNSLDLANSYIQISFTYQIVNNKLHYKVSCYFYKYLSWIKYNMPTLLSHEQGHFDIAKLFALKLEQKFKEYRLATNVNDDLHSIYVSIVAERLAMDKLFDEKIKGARNEIPQKEFIANIRKQIPCCDKERGANKKLTSRL